MSHHVLLRAQRQTFLEIMEASQPYAPGDCNQHYSRPNDQRAPKPVTNCPHKKSLREFDSL
ncbi:hypothetical protein TRAPUB_10813 [Trametes pubescens]|uniref:Uncharacterized protein n=1 Tax=Trametes pubescens TaxID=154538 RepID=A0A1M2VYH1_TRAPU|nr:hypothetical protein TRAPUB_10813 [Trametes pubescens]